jgi:hypothetical protein
MRRLLATVLGLEAIVILLAIPVALTIEHDSASLGATLPGALALAAVLLAAVAGRPGQGWSLIAGTVLQLGVIAVGVIVPAMYALGAIFLGLWLTGMWLGYHHEGAPRSRGTG